MGWLAHGLRADTGAGRTPDAGVLLRSCPEPPGAYLHVPFCSRICPFCPYDKMRFERGRAARYFIALAREVDRWVAASRVPFRSLYVGGGTPTLCLDELIPIVGRIPVAGERAIEILPEHAKETILEGLERNGFSFVSIGVQSFDPEVLRHLGRPSDPDTLRLAVERAVRRFDCVDIDLIFDVGFGNIGTLLDDLRTAFALGVHQVSTYPLIRFGYTPFGTAPVTTALERVLLERADALASEHGYERRAVWTFQRPHAPSYSSITRDLYVGMGASAASFTGSWFTVNHFSPERYCAALETRQPIARAWRMPRTVAAVYWAFWQAYAGSIDLARLQLLFGHSRLTLRLLGACERAGWLVRSGSRLLVTPIGRARFHDLERRITRHYIEPLWADLLREHAPADRPAGLRAKPGFLARLQRHLPLVPA